MLAKRFIHILFRPTEEWRIINSERTTIWRLFLCYVIPMTALWPIAAIAATIIGVLEPAVGRSPVIGFYLDVMHGRRDFIADFLIEIMLAYGTALVLAFAMVLVIYLLAPAFRGQKDLLRALELVVYASTPVWCGLCVVAVGEWGIRSWRLNSIGSGFLLSLACSYAVYLLHLGLPLLMRVPKEKVSVYMGDVMIFVLVLAWLLNPLRAWRWRRALTFVETWNVYYQEVTVVLVIIAFVGLAIIYARNHQGNAEN